MRDRRKEDVKYFINASVHTRGCNLKCDYCYLSQANYKCETGANALRYPIEHIRKALSKDRIGISEIGLIGDGETLLPNDIVPLIIALLEEGHYLTIVTNGTLSDKIKQIVEWIKCENREEQMNFSVSLHYLELKRLNLLDNFADTISYLRKNGIKYTVSLTFGGSYIPYVEEINEYCYSKLETKPEVYIARESCKDGTIKILSGEYSKEEYYEAVKKLPVDEEFEVRWNNFNCKSDEFCYAGKWIFQLDMTTGLCTQCLGNDANKFNLFEHIDKEIPLCAVGYRCKQPYCICGWKDTYNLMPDEQKQCNIRTDLSLINQLYTDEEKEECNRRNIIFEDLRNKSLYASRCFYEKDYETGLALAEELLANDLDPSNYYVASLVVKYGYALMETGKLEKALDLASCYDDLNYLADYCMMLGCVYLKIGMVENAIKLFEDATQRYATYEEGTNTWLPLYNLGVIYECLGEIDTAIGYYKKCGNYMNAKNRIKELA